MRNSPVWIIAFAIVFIAGFGCGDDGSSADPSEGVGETETFEVGGSSLGFVQLSGSLVLPPDSGSNFQASPRPLERSYSIAETPVTYEVWAEVYEWAVNGTGGAEGEGQYGPFASDQDLEFREIEKLGRMGSEESGEGMDETHPVTMINWEGAVIFANAMTEWHNATNGADLEPVYTDDQGEPIRDYEAVIDAYHPGDGFTVTSCACDFSEIDEGADGFRLPTAKEWEAAARYIGPAAPSTGDDIDGDAVEQDGIYWTPGFGYASGATNSSDEAIGKVAWFDGNTETTQPVAQKEPNALGLYDMSGLVQESTFTGDYDEEGESMRRLMFGGSYLGGPVGDLYPERRTAGGIGTTQGIRLARTTD